MPDPFDPTDLTLSRWAADFRRYIAESALELLVNSDATVEQLHHGDRLPVLDEAASILLRHAA